MYAHGVALCPTSYEVGSKEACALFETEQSGLQWAVSFTA